MLSRDVQFKPEETRAKYANLPKINERENLHVQSDDDMYESAESDLKVIEQPQVAEENVRQLRDRRTTKQTDFCGCPAMYVAEKSPSDFNEAMKSEKKELIQIILNIIKRVLL